MNKKNILVIDDDTIILDSLCEFLKLEGFRTSGAETLKGALARLEEEHYTLVITDVNLPDGDGLELLDIIRENHPQTVTIVITGYGTIESAVKAIKQGAYEYLTKPIIDDELRLAVGKALAERPRHWQLRQEKSFEPTQQTVRRGKLRSTSGNAARKRAVRPRQRVIYRRCK